MSDFDKAWLSLMVKKLRSGALFSRDLVSACVYELKDKNSTESVKATEAWIDVYWGGCKNIPKEEFLAIHWWSRGRRGALLHRILM